MTKGNQFTRALALSTALSVVALGATTTAAEATLDPGKSQGKSQSADKGQSKDKAKGQNKSQGHEKKSAPSKGSSDKGDDHPSSNGHSNGNGQSKGGSTAGAGSTDKGSTDKGDNVGGNNGTVKIDGWTLAHGTGNGAPNRNEPHVDCTFDVEWYNFDASVTSTVTFAMQAPTADVELGEYDTSVDLDDDGANGANADGLDAVQPYELTFTGEPHPKHGYHVKLTVNTPISNGADVKHKVFWVEPCEDEVQPPPPGGEEEQPPPPGEEEQPPGTPEVEVEGQEGNDLENEIEVLGEQANVGSEVNGQQGNEALPSAVDAGFAGADTVSPTSSLPLMLTLYGALIAGLALLIRRRTT